MVEVSASVPAQPGTAAPGVVAREWSTGWPVVLAGLFGYMNLTIATATMGAFMAPMESEFGWSRADFTSGFSVLPIASMTLAVPVGILIDRFGPRPIAVIGAVLCMLSYSLFATANSSIGYWLALWLFFSVVHQLVIPALWTTAIANAFTQSRGLAMSTTMLGSSMIFGIGPIAANLLIENYGWRVAFVGLGSIVGLLLLLASLFGLPATPRRGPLRSLSAKAPALATGVTVLAGVKSGSFIKLGAVTVISYVVSMAVIVHLIAILSSAGLTRNAAVVIGGSIGLAMIAGKLLVGLAFDRFSGRLVAAIATGFQAMSLAMLAVPVQSIGWAWGAVALFGISYGATAPLFPYLSTRYFGMRSYARLFSILMCLAALGTAIGPLVAAQLYDLAHNYWLFLTGAIPALLIAMCLLASLGPYPDFETTSCE